MRNRESEKERYRGGKRGREGESEREREKGGKEKEREGGEPIRFLILMNFSN